VISTRPNTPKCSAVLVRSGRAPPCRGIVHDQHRAAVLAQGDQPVERARSPSIEIDAIHRDEGVPLPAPARPDNSASRSASSLCRNFRNERMPPILMPSQIEACTRSSK